MPKKTPGRPNPPPPQADFDKLDLKRFCVPLGGIFYRVHGREPSTGNPFHPIHFSRRGTSRFDPTRGIGTLCVGKSLPVALMEVFDDSWGAVGAPSRALTATRLGEWWVTLVWVPQVQVFEARGANLSKIGTDQQLVTGRHSTARRWALRVMRHPGALDGILYPSRHTTNDFNVALFQRPQFLPAVFDPALAIPFPTLSAGPGGALAYGPPLQLAQHPERDLALRELEVAVLP